MLRPCSVNKLRTSMRSCGSRFPQRKTSFFKSLPSALQGEFILVKHPLGNLKKAPKLRGIGFVSACSFRPGVV